MKRFLTGTKKVTELSFIKRKIRTWFNKRELKRLAKRANYKWIRF